MSRIYYEKIVLGLVLIAGFLVFSPALWNDFVGWKDTALITNNLDIVQFSMPSIAQFFSQDYSGNYMPLTMLTWALEYQLFGANASAFISLSLLIHLLNVALVYFLLKRMLTASGLLCALGALVFAVHPIHTEAVVWIVARPDLLYSFFYLLALWFYLDYLAQGTQQPVSAIKNKSYWLCLSFFLISLLSSVQAVTLPLVLFLLDYLNTRSANSGAVKEKIIFFVLSLVFGLLALYFKGAFSEGGGIYPADLSQQFLLAAYALVSYIGKILLPFNLSPLYPLPSGAQVFSAGEYLPFVMGAIVLMSLMLWSYLKHFKYLFFGLAFFVVNVLFMLDYTPIGNTVMADRFTYLALFGFSVVLIAGLRQISKSPKMKITAFALVAVFVLYDALLAFSYSPIWKNYPTLFSYAIAQNDQHPVAHDAMGRYYFSQGDTLKARQHYEKALTDMPDYYNVLFNMGELEETAGHDDEAIRYYSLALKQTNNKDDLAFSYYKRGLIHYNRGKIEPALADFDDAISQFTKSEIKASKIKTANLQDLHFLMGHILVEKTQYKAAYQYYSTAVKMGVVDNRYNTLASVLLNLIKHQQSVELTTDMQAQLYEHIATIMRGQKHYNLALRYFSKAIESDGTSIRAYVARAELRSKFYNDHRGAIIDLQKALALEAKNAGLIYTLANEQAMSGNIEQSFQLYDKALDINPQYADAYLNKGLLHLQLKQMQAALDALGKAKQYGARLHPGLLNLLEKSYE